MRTRTRRGVTLGVAGILALTSSCVTAPTPSEVLATGFRTPEQAFATFRTALRADLVDLEYRCWSAAFKRREGISYVTYAHGREELFRSQPFARLVGNAEVLESTPSGPDRVTLLVEVGALFVEKRFLVHMLRSDFYEAHDPGGLVGDDFAEWDEIVATEGGDLVVRIPMPEGVRPGELVDVRAAREWKIDGFEELHDE